MIMISPSMARGVLNRHRCGLRILICSPAPLEHDRTRRRSHTIWLGHATIWQQWSSLAKPSVAARAAASTAVADVVGSGGGGRGGGGGGDALKAGIPAGAAAPKTSTTATTTRSIKIRAAATSCTIGSTARVTGVSEAAAVGGSGDGGGGAGDSSNRRQYWATDNTKGAFVAEPSPAQSIEVGENKNPVNTHNKCVWRWCCCYS